MTVLLLTGAVLGTVGQIADPDSSRSLEFGKTMMAKFLHNLENKTSEIDTVICYTEGVFNALRGSETSLSLSFMQDRGCQILLCSTCLDHYSLTPEQMIGTVSDMATISSILVKADKVIRP
ncbi:MAG: DsrE family protein [Candidatus Bruticola sp.]